MMAKSSVLPTPLRRFLACTAHFGAPLALLTKASSAVRPLRPVTVRLNQMLSHYTDARAKRFDAKYGTDTFERVPMATLGLQDAENRDFDNWAYGPICSDFFHEMMRAIPRSGELVFFDVGTGKGLPLLLAGEHGFRRIVGIELSQELCDIAARNIEKFNARAARRVDAEIICGDFMKHDLGSEPTVFFLNNPFPSRLALPAMKHIEESIVRHHRRVVIAYRRMQAPTLRYLLASKHFKIDLTTPYWQIFSSR
jgi:predicted RNA methylase